MGTLGFNDFLRGSSRHSLRLAHLAKLNDDIYWHVVQVRKLETLNIQLWNLKQDFSRLLRRKVALEAGTDISEVEKPSMHPPYKLPKHKRYLSRKAAESSLAQLQARYFNLIEREKDVHKELELFKHDIARLTLKLYRLETGSGSNPSVTHNKLEDSVSTRSDRNKATGRQHEDRKSKVMRLTLSSTLSPNECQLDFHSSGRQGSSSAETVRSGESKESERPISINPTCTRASNIIAISESPQPIVTSATAAPRPPKACISENTSFKNISSSLKEPPITISEVFNSTDSGGLGDSVLSEDVDLLPILNEIHSDSRSASKTSNWDQDNLGMLDAQLQAEREAAAILDAYASEEDDWSPFDWIKIAQLAVT